MKLSATPILLGNEANAFDVDTDTSISPQNFVNLLDQHKALLLQGSEAVLTVQDFGKLVVGFQLTPYPYIGGAAPRRIIPVDAGKDIVFTANESPPDQPIPFHHELAQTPSPPEYVFFYCDHPAQEGGQTPLIDSTLVYRFAQENHPDFISKLRVHGARYIRTLPAEDDSTSPIGRSYQKAYNVDSHEQLESKLATEMVGASCAWLPDGSVRITTQAVPAIRLVGSHATNHVFQETFSNSIIAAYLGWQDVRNDRHDALRFGNMEKMDENVLESIAGFMERERIMYSWKKGDIIAINNMLVMHSRNPFVGERRVYASIWGPPASKTFPPKNGVAIGARPDAFFLPLEPADPLVFGFWKVSKETVAEVCYQAIAAGYRRLDCACDYGNEKEVGEGIARAIKDGLCARDDLFVTSKLWNTYHKPEHVPLAVSRTLEDLQLEYIDEYLIHFPISTEYVPIETKYPPEWTNTEGKMVIVANDMCATWKALEELYEKGLLKTIGVCNFSTQLLRQILSICRIRPSTLQIELHPHNSQEKLVRFARDAGMHVTAFSVFGASSYIELDMATQTDLLMQDKTICEIAQKKSKSPAQVLLRWAIQRNTNPLCKTSTTERMAENRNVFDFYLTGEEMRRINALNKNRRYNDPGAFCEPGMGTFCPIYE
ncbi:hypothetical protein MPSEU_000148100 [Mayamaea pseudoterrestris]|nr:hypothetical protein MPSEU_000148100 [Mayamaea pseudoterrestris]